MAENRVVTLYHLLGVEPTLDGLFEALDAERLDELEFAPLFPEFPAGSLAYLVRGHFKIPKVEWSADLSQLVGEDTSLDDKKAAALLLVAVEGEVFAMGFGQGYRLVPDELKDPDFGLRFAVRAVDPDRVRDIVRKSMIRVGRQDATFMSAGQPIGSIGVRRHAEIVRKLGGELSADMLGLEGNGEMAVDGSAGLRLSIPLDSAKLVTLLEHIIRICETDVHPSFAFIEAIRPVRDTALSERLDRLLGKGILGERDILLSLSIPVDLSHRLADAMSYNIRIGAAWLRGRPSLEMDDIATRCRVVRCLPAAALRKGRIELSDQRDGHSVLGSAPAIRWLEAAVAIGDRQYLLIDGEWHEIGAEFLSSISGQVKELIAAECMTTLPAWTKGERERDYNLRVQDELGRSSYLCLDRQGVRTDFHRNGFEVCDLLGPEGELICVKPAKGSGPLSHLFNQGFVAVETLLHDPEARRRFSELVAAASFGTRSVPLDYRPKKVVFAIHLTTGRTLTPDSLFPFAQVALVNMATTLKSLYDVDVEVIGIPPESASDPRP